MRKSYSSTFKAEVVLELLRGEKTVTQLATEYAVHPNLLLKWKVAALEALPMALERRDSLEAARVAHEQQVQELEADIERLTTQLAWLKKKVGALPRAERMAMIERGEADLPLTIQAGLLELGYSSLYYRPTPRSLKHVVIHDAIRRLYTENPTYSAQSIVELLKEHYHISLNRKTVLRHMRVMGIARVRTGRKRSPRNPEGDS